MDNAQDPSGDMVSLMTLHSAKGLEFDTVFLPGWEEGVFRTSGRSTRGACGGRGGARLAYVGMTRAKRSLTVSYAANRRIYNQWAASMPSRFIEELPAEHTEFLQRQHVPEPQMSGWFDDLRAGGRGPGSRACAAGKAPLIDGQALVLTTELPEPPRDSGRAAGVPREVRLWAGAGGRGPTSCDRLRQGGTKKVIDSFVAPA